MRDPSPVVQGRTVLQDLQVFSVVLVGETNESTAREKKQRRPFKIDTMFCSEGRQGQLG